VILVVVVVVLMVEGRWLLVVRSLLVVGCTFVVGCWLLVVVGVRESSERYNGKTELRIRNA
jgi:hypothetical protein